MLFISDKSTATTFALVHRPQNDPQIHDASSSQMVFQELAPSQAHKIQSRNALESQLFGSSSSKGALKRVRDNEGEAAEYGVYYDDTEYDYMQHMRDLGSGAGDEESYFIEAPVKRKAGKGQGKVRLEDALREASLEDEVGKKTGASILDEDVLPSKNLRKTTYQDQQDVPDILAGFQPDMDARLREVLEALEDEAYVDDEDDYFGELAKGGNEVSEAEFEQLGFEENERKSDDEGWESDNTERPIKEYKKTALPLAREDADISMGDGSDHGDGNWMKEFSKFKKDDESKVGRPNASNYESRSSIMTGTSITGSRRKKRKGAVTSSTGYSMTSSSLLRTEGLTLLDARFDKMQEDYAEDEMEDDNENVSVMTGTSSSSQAPQLSSGFDNMMDEFLNNYSMSGKKRVKKGKYQTGMEQLDEIRSGLGSARVRTQKA